MYDGPYQICHNILQNVFKGLLNKKICALLFKYQNSTSSFMSYLQLAETFSNYYYIELNLLFIFSNVPLALYINNFILIFEPLGIFWKI